MYSVFARTEALRDEHRTERNDGDADSQREGRMANRGPRTYGNELLPMAVKRVDGGNEARRGAS